MNQILETERLVLRQFTTDDTAFIIELVNSAGWLEFIGDRGIKTTEQATNYLQNGPIKSYEENGFGLSMVALKEDQTPIGMCGIIKRPGLEAPDLGFAFLPEFMGKGFAFEIAYATVKFAKETLKLQRVIAITNPANKTSIKLLEKTGFTFIETFKLQPGGPDLLLFTTTKFKNPA